jgi:hypothetical protein
MKRFGKYATIVGYQHLEKPVATGDNTGDSNKVFGETSQ